MNSRNLFVTPMCRIAEKWRVAVVKRSLSSCEAEHVDLKNAILRNTRVTRDHLTPEIGLHLLTPDCPFYHAPISYERGRDVLEAATIMAFQDPFWSIYWPGGQGLTRYILDRGRALFSRGISTSVLDLGCGCGAAAIAAKISGATKVVANDVDPVACVAIGMNAELNRVQLQICGRNLLAENYRHDFDVIFVGDLLYDEEISGILVPWLDQASRRGARVYLGDPGRHGLTDILKKRLTKLCDYHLPDNVRRENYGFDTSTVWEFSSG